ncbi:MAG TPA: hypothetical protein VN026_03815, partial [Bacteroidia bacterium]|nr:hypothetical protein [Bacteroidia bacterium]
YDGVVLSKHMVPMPNVSVGIPLGHGEHKSGGGGPLSGTTDKDGKFKITGKVCHNCWGYEINVRTADSGFVEHQNISSTSNITVILK